MLTRLGLEVVLERLEDMAVVAADVRRARDRLRGQNHELRQELDLSKAREQDRAEQLAKSSTQLTELTDDLVRCRTAHRATLIELDALRRRKSLFPFELDGGNHVYVAFENAANHVTGVKDDAGEYQNAGRAFDYAALIAAPLNPRCYLACPALNLVRLPHPPEGRLLIDDVPF